MNSNDAGMQCQFSHYKDLGGLSSLVLFDGRLYRLTRFTSSVASLRAIEGYYPDVGTVSGTDGI